MEETRNVCGDVEVEKIKVTEAEVIVHRVTVGFYFMIKYKEAGEEHYNIGFGSYNIHMVFDWLNKYFEIVSQESEN